MVSECHEARGPGEQGCLYRSLHNYQQYYSLGFLLVDFLAIALIVAFGPLSYNMPQNPLNPTSVGARMSCFKAGRRSQELPPYCSKGLYPVIPGITGS